MEVAFATLARGKNGVSFVPSLSKIPIAVSGFPESESIGKTTNCIVIIAARKSNPHMGSRNNDI